MLDVARLDVIQCSTALEVRLLASLNHERKQRQRVQEQLNEITKVVEDLAKQIADQSPAPAAPPSPPKYPPCVLDMPADRACAGGATIKQIQLAVCDRFNLSLVELRSQRRQEYLTLARQTFCMLAKALTTKSFPEIGRSLGGRDHATIVHATRKFAPIYERLMSELTPEDTLATWVKHAYNMVIREHVPLVKPKPRPPKNSVETSMEPVENALAVSGECGSFEIQPKEHANGGISDKKLETVSALQSPLPTVD